MSNIGQLTESTRPTTTLHGHRPLGYIRTSDIQQEQSNNKRHQGPLPLYPSSRNTTKNKGGDGRFSSTMTNPYIVFNFNPVRLSGDSSIHQGRTALNHSGLEHHHMEALVIN